MDQDELGWESEEAGWAEPQRRTRAPEGKGSTVADRLGALAAIGLFLLAMLLVSNLLLWQAVRDDGGPASGDARGAGAGSAAEALLPAPTQGESNLARARELDRLTGRLDRQFDSLQSSLFPLVNAAGSTAAIPGGLADVSTKLDTLNGQLGLLGGPSGAFPALEDPAPAIADLEAQLGRVRNTIAGVRRNTTAVSKTASRLGDTNRGIARTNQGLAATNGGIARTNRGIANTNDALGSTNGGIAQTNTGIAQTNRGIDATNSGVGTTNQRLSTVSATLERLEQTMNSVDKRTSGVADNTEAMVAALQTTNSTLGDLLFQMQAVNGNLSTVIVVTCAGDPNPPPQCP